VIECKNGVTSGNGISKKDVGQLGQSVAWFSVRYPASAWVPVIFHRNSTLGQGASVVSGMRAITPTNLDKLRHHLRSFAKQIADGDIAANASEVARRLADFELNGSAFLNAFSVPVRP